MLSGRSLARQIAVSTLYSLDFNNELERAEEIDLSIFPGMTEEELSGRGGIDFSPVIALIALNLAERLLFNIIL